MATHDGESSTDPQLIAEKMSTIDNLILRYDYENHDINLSTTFSDPAKSMQRASDYQLLRDTALNHYYVKFAIPRVISHYIRNIQIYEHIPDDIQSLIVQFWSFDAIDILSEKREAMIHFTLCENVELEDMVDELKEENHLLSVERDKLVSAFPQLSATNCTICSVSLYYF